MARAPDLPEIRLAPGGDKRLRRGYPWIFANEVQMTPAAKALEKGAFVTLRAAGGDVCGTAMFNAHSLIAARLVDSRGNAPLDGAELERRLARALRLRQRLFETPFFRLVHAEGDALPGLVIDRYGDVVVCQAGTAGMDRLNGAIADALESLLKPRAVVFKNDSAARLAEGLAQETRLARGTLEGAIDVVENGLRFRANPMEGQKTGWFFDQRANRARIAHLSKGKRVLDAYCHTGGFALAALAAGAESALGIDASAEALALAGEAAALNGLEAKTTWRKADVFDALPHLAGEGRSFDVVVCDPPAFAKSRKDVESAAKGYRKLARLGARVTAEEGVLFIASCSHHMERDRFRAEVAQGIESAGRPGRILAETGADSDHPVHPMLPETAYLKGLLIALD